MRNDMFLLEPVKEVHLVLPSTNFIQLFFKYASDFRRDITDQTHLSMSPKA